MANHPSAKKRARQSEKKRVHNRYFSRTARNAIRALRGTKEKQQAEEMLPKVYNMIDKLNKKNIIHKNKAANIKSSLATHVNNLK